VIRRIRLLVLLTRPAVIVLLGLFTVTGLAEAGRGGDKALLARVLLAVAGFLLFSVACNDLADEAIDRVNLPGRRPLVTGAATRREFTVIAVTAGAVALVASTALHWPAVVVTAAGLAVSAGYSLRPVRLADRGAVASLVLPACYVAVPYLDGVFAARPFLTSRDLLLLAGLYLAFIGRILLKDFRDVRGDALFGKRTFLVRHGRGWTCVFSACAWLVGTAVILAATNRLTGLLVLTEGACLAAALVLLANLAASRGARRDETLIAAIAITGRGMIALLFAHLSMVGAGWLAGGGSFTALNSGLPYNVVLGTLCLLTLGPAATMAAYGPLTTLTLAPAAPAHGGAPDPVPARAGAAAGAQPGVAACPPGRPAPAAPSGSPALANSPNAA
jgi:4-hydroxybenzoate polyprenyltransferase